MAALPVIAYNSSSAGISELNRAKFGRYIAVFGRVKINDSSTTDWISKEVTGLRRVFVSLMSHPDIASRGMSRANSHTLTDDNSFPGDVHVRDSDASASGKTMRFLFIGLGA